MKKLFCAGRIPTLRHLIAILMAALVLSAIECSAQSKLVPYTFTTLAGYPANNYPYSDYAEGDAGSVGDGINSDAGFDYPEAMAMDSQTNIYIADTYANIIRKMSPVPSGWSVTTIAGQTGVSGFQDSPNALQAKFNGPAGIAVDSSGNIFISDTGNNLIRLLTPGGGVSTIAGNTQTLTQGGYEDGQGLQAEFNEPYGIAVDIYDNLYVADYNNDMVRKLVKTTLSDWQVSTLVGGSTGGSPLNNPSGITVDGSGNIYVADTFNNRIEIVTPAGAVSTLAGSPPSVNQLFDFYDGIAYPDQDGQGTNAGFDEPCSVSLDAAGNVYVADSIDNEIRKISPDGWVTTIGGDPAFIQSYGGEPSPMPNYAIGTGSQALFFSPEGVVADANGNVYVADTWNCVIREGMPPTVWVAGLEVTQVIQDWNNDVPLIQNKDTYFRAHMQLPFLALDTPVQVSGAMLYGMDEDGSPLPNSPIKPINQGGSLVVTTANAADPTVRENFLQSLNFQLPPEWLIGSIKLQLKWPGELVPVGGVVPNSMTVAASFTSVPPLPVKFFDVQWTDADGLHQIGPDIDNLRAHLLSAYPVPDIDPTYGSITIPGLVTPDFGSSAHSFVNMVMEMLDGLHGSDTTAGQRIFYGGISAVPVGDPLNPSNPDGIGYIPGFASCGTYFGNYGVGSQTVSHEIGHNLGLDHDVNGSLFKYVSPPDPLNPAAKSKALGACGETQSSPGSQPYTLFNPVAVLPEGTQQRPTLGPIPDDDDSAIVYGFDSYTWNRLQQNGAPVLASQETVAGDPLCYFDLMSYCRNGGPEDRWPSTVTYMALLNSIKASYANSPSQNQVVSHPLAIRVGNGKPRSGTPQGSPGGGQNYLIVRGAVNFTDGTAEFLPFLPLTTTNAPPQPQPGTNFVLEAYDSHGNLIESLEFALLPAVNETIETNAIDNADFFVALTNNGNINSVVLSCNGQALTETTAPSTPPTVSLTYPNGGQTFTGGSINVTWTGSDSSGETLTYTVQYSADDGTTWQTLCIDLPSESLAVNSAQLAATTQGFVRVIVSDGFNTATAQSAATFTVQPHPPAVIINAPMPGTVFIQDQQLFLNASIYDMQDGSLTGTNVQWNSDRNGFLGTGAIISMDATVLSEGYHNITATAKDNEGLTNSATTQILVLHYAQPQMIAQYTRATNGNPAYGSVTWPSYYTNYVLQTSSNLASGWKTVTNNPPEVLGNQQTVTLGTTNKAIFFRLALQP